MWGADGKTLYYMSDRSGAKISGPSLHSGAAKEITHFRDGRCCGRRFQMTADDRM